MKRLDVNTRNVEILAVLQQAVPMLRSLAFQFGYEYDELHQMAAVAALENYEKAQGTPNPLAYLYGVIRNVLWYAPREERPLSLDEPLDDESGTSLIDMLPAPALFEVDPKREEKKTRALYASLRKLPLEVQLYICRVHDLNAYRPARPRKGRFAGKRPDLSRDTSALSRQAYAALRRDQRLRAAICGEGPGKLPDLDFARDFTLWQ